MKDLAGKVAVVTGAANGIGRGLATRFLQEGMKVVLADNDVADLAAASAELSALGEVLPVPTDVSDAASVQALADASVAHFGAVHVLCNNAGVGGFQRFSTTSLETWRWIVGVDLWGVIYGCNIFLPILAAQQEAHIVNTASMSGFLNTSYHHPYQVSKQGVVALSEGLFLEFATEHPNVGVSVVSPAFTATAIRNDERNAPAGHVPRAIADPELEAMRERAYRDVEAGLDVAAVADLVVQGMADKTLFLFPHPDWKQYIQMRTDMIISGANPQPLTLADDTV